jgi:hypothetical protein
MNERTKSNLLLSLTYIGLILVLLILVYVYHVFRLSVINQTLIGISSFIMFLSGVNLGILIGKKQVE